MPLQTVLGFLVAAGVLIAIPGPNHLYIASRSVARGRAAGLAVAVGVELGTMVHVLLAAVGLSYVLATSAAAFTVVRLAGAGYLFYLAWRALRGPRRTPATEGPTTETATDSPSSHRTITGDPSSAALKDTAPVDAAPSRRARGAEGASTASATADRERSWVAELGQGMLVNLFNPKVILFFVAFVPQFLDPRVGPVWQQVVILGALLISLGVTSNVIYALASSSLAAMLRRRTGDSVGVRTGRVVQAVIYATLGVLALLTRPQH